MDERAHRAIGPLLRGRRVVVVTEVLAAVTASMPLFEEFGADVRAICGVLGVGDLPAIEFRLLGGAPGSIMEGIWAFERMAKSPPTEVIGWLDEWDPDRSALVLAPILGDFGEVAGRRAYGARRPEWGALEDKMVIDEVWDAAGVARAPREVVRVADGPRAHASFGGESVWVADNRDGWHGGADRVRWIWNDGQLEEAVAFFEGVADRVRVMPFLEGVPCSIHGYVVPHRVHAFRPVELLMLRDRRRGRFVYASVATSWDPHPADRTEMRAMARQVGRYLSQSVGYLGGFSIDGVMTVDGFRPTELNPRLSAGLGVQWGSLGQEFPLGTLTRMLNEGDLDATMLDDVEDLVVRGADERRMGRVMLSVPEEIPSEQVPVRLDGGHLHQVVEGGVATVEVGPGPSGSTVMAVFDDVPAGERFGPRAAAVAEFAAARWGLDLGSLEIAPSVRMIE
jgi:hypothetical protein